MVINADHVLRSSIFQLHFSSLLSYVSFLMCFVCYFTKKGENRKTENPKKPHPMSERTSLICDYV